MTWERIRRECGLSARNFVLLRKTIAEHSKNYTLRIERGEQGWLDSFIDGGIGARFWGPGTKEKWSFPGNRVEIRKLLLATILYSVKDLPSRHRKSPKRPRKSREVYHGRLPREQAVPPPRRPVRHPLERVNCAKTPDKRLQKKQSPVVTVRPNTRSRSALVRLNLGSEDESVAITTGEIPEHVALEENSSVALEENPSVALEKHPSGFILEANRVGSSEITLIHSAHVPTLAHLVEKICKNDGLEEHQILGIDVKMGDRLFNVGLDDRRDWVYISKVIFESGSGAELVFWI